MKDSGGKKQIPTGISLPFITQKCLLREINLMRDTETAADMPFLLANETWFLCRLHKV